jgi:argininosuccinate lyase
VSKEVVRFTEGRLKVEPSEQLKKYVTETVLQQDLETFDQYLRIDLAHVVMLAKQGVIPEDEAAKILKVEREIRRAGVDAFPRDTRYDSLIGQVEASLFSQVGKEIGGKVHTGRSRIDMNMAIQMLYTRDRLLDIGDSIIGLQHVILDLAEKHAETVMPGYTHLQHAQPWTFGHYILSFFYQFDRTFDRLKGAFARTNLNPLGTAALTGSPWPLDREITRRLLGFEGLLTHSKDAGAFTPDSVLEVIADSSILMWQISLLFTDLYLWCSFEFGMIDPDPGYCGTSSIMPQKKNPYSIEAIVSQAGLAIGWLPMALGALRMPSSSAAFWAYGGRRLYIFEILKVLEQTLELAAGTLRTMKVREERMKERAGAFWSTATQLADTIAKEKDMAFRIAHQIVGRLVSDSVEKGISTYDVTSAMVDEAAKEITGSTLGLPEDVVKAALNPRNTVLEKATVGSVNPDETRRMIKECTAKLDEELRWATEKRTLLKNADAELDKAIESILKKHG